VTPTPATVEQIRQARPDVSIHVYPGRHGFNCDARQDFDQESARLAKERTLVFLERYLG